ncbi:hypothetical protein F52700_3998 [Fusarium sp. NRRL 52700]|nr:hypothetical protein F52700_3998 [Fusarium sp. NRRL 52700]
MFRSHLIFSLASLAYLSVLVTAQCNVTATYESCCTGASSSENKVVMFQGREFRVHCNDVMVPDPSFEANPADCAKKCSSQPDCVNAVWQPPSSGGGSGRCDSYLITTQARSVSFVGIDSAECQKELQNCQNSKPAETTCPADLESCKKSLKNCDQNCPGRLKTCEGSLKNCDQNCPGRLKNCEGSLKNCDQNCPGRLKTCEGSLRNCDSSCPGNLKQCQDDRNDLRQSLNKCKEDRNSLTGETRDLREALNKCRDDRNKLSDGLEQCKRQRAR